MKCNYSVELHTLINEFRLEVVYGPEDYQDKLISSRAVCRPALPLAGFFEHFDPDDIQVIGRAETSYLQSLSRDDRLFTLDRLLALKPPMLVLSNGVEADEDYIFLCKKHNIPLLRSGDYTSSFISALSASLNVHLGERCTIHGVLVDVYGIGVLLTGDSGIGKSEAALELIKRGHRLVSDDVVEIRKVSEVTLIGIAPPITKHFIELRGIGIIDVKTLFGVSSVRDSQSIDMEIHLEEWDRNREYDRLGMEDNYTEYLGNKVVCHNIPIRPGRSLAIICESAAVNHRQKKMGYNAAKELYSRVQNSLAKKREDEN
jgi:HPr kinase/phosphorylase